jgi:copper chaperone CopZ
MAATCRFHPFVIRYSRFDINLLLSVPRKVPMLQLGGLIGVLLLAAVVSSPATAAEQPEDRLAKVRTAIVVEDMHCADCAKKIARKLYAIKGVKGVRAVVKTNTATVTPETGKQPSPLALWEAVEEAGFTPVKLIGPAGEFKKKPKQ